MNLFETIVIDKIVNALEAAKVIQTDQDKISMFNYNRLDATTMQANVRIDMPQGQVTVNIEVDTGS